MAVLAMSNWILVVIIVLVVLGIWWGNVEMVKIVFQRQAEKMRRQREAYQFVLDNFDTFIDEKKGVVTETTLLRQKFKASEEDRAKIQIVIDTLNRHGRVIETIKLGETTRYVFGASRDDLERAIANSN